MKHVDLRQTWVRELRTSGDVEFCKVPGTENKADFFTKILSPIEFERMEERLMPRVDAAVIPGKILRGMGLLACTFIHSFIACTFIHSLGVTWVLFLDAEEVYVM